IVLVGLCAGFPLSAGSAPTCAQSNPSSFPVREAHQGVQVAADPYVSASRSKTRFGKHTPYDGGILAIDVNFQNDTDSPVRIKLDTVELRLGRGGQRQRLAAIS